MATATLAGGWLCFSGLRLTIADQSEGRRVIRSEHVYSIHDFMRLATDAADKGDDRLIVAWQNLTSPRPPIHPAIYHRTLIMGILNVTPDSFSDGGDYAAATAALAHGIEMARAGADFIDIGGESTRPGAMAVPAEEQWRRVGPVITGLCDYFDREVMDHAPPMLSIDTRSAHVMERASKAGARMINDVSGLTFDPASLVVAARLDGPVVVMHAQGKPDTMQQDPTYDDPLFDIYDWMAARIVACVAGGIARDRIILDPGVGFGKRLDHNLRLLRHVALFHALGCPLLLGVSRKRFIGDLTGVENPRARIFGSLGAALWLAAQGVQILRVHDLTETQAAIGVWQGLAGTDP